MATIPPVILVLDVNALSTATPREWLEFSRVGSCIVPQAVYEEMKFLFDRSPDPDLERIAKAFNRFYSTSGWQVSDAHAHHPVLKTVNNQSLTKRSRVSLAVGRCAYGLSQTFPSSLVVLVSSDRSMLQRIYDIQSTNLCAITGQALLQWCRTGQRPIAVSQKLQRLRSTGGSGMTTGINTTIQTTTTPSRITTSRSRSAVRDTSELKDLLSQITSLVLALAALMFAGWLLWRLVNDAGLREQWRPSNSPAPTQQSP
ncbi:MAG TPA: PIN domain-containing protein [Chroococcidiopsis sp.]